MVNILGIELTEGLLYTLIIAGVIFYVFMMWFILQILRRRMPIRILKLGLGQSMTEHKGREDDLKVYWKEGFYGKEHEALKLTKERIKPVWGRSVRVFLVREDLDETIPFAVLTSQSKKTIPKSLFGDEGLIIKQLCKDCINKVEKIIPKAITVNFMQTDELKGKSTEALSKRRNMDFVETASRIMRKVAKGDVFLYLLLGAFSGSFFTLIVMILSKTISLG